MKFEIKKSIGKDPAIYKTLYIRQGLVEQINDLARQNDTSWNNVVISMIESCLKSLS